MELCAQDLISGHHHHHHDVCTVLQQQLLLSACYSFLLLLNSWQDISYPDTCHRLICILLIDRGIGSTEYTQSKHIPNLAQLVFDAFFVLLFV